MSGKKNGNVLNEVENVQESPMVETTTSPITALVPLRTDAETRLQKMGEFEEIANRYRVGKAKKEELSKFLAGMDGSAVTLVVSYGTRAFEVKSLSMIREVCDLMGMRISEYVDNCKTQVESFSL